MNRMISATTLARNTIAKHLAKGQLLEVHDGIEMNSLALLPTGYDHAGNKIVTCHDARCNHSVLAIKPVIYIGECSCSLCLAHTEFTSFYQKLLYADQLFYVSSSWLCSELKLPQYQCEADK
jgi:hypothetical protein